MVPSQLLEWYRLVQLDGFLLIRVAGIFAAQLFLYFVGTVLCEACLQPWLLVSCNCFCTFFPDVSSFEGRIKISSRTWREALGLPELLFCDVTREFEY